MFPVGPSLDHHGSAVRAALKADGSANSSTRPAAAGEVLTLYATGEGLTDGPNISGQTAQSPYPRPRLPVSLKIANVTAQVVDAFSAPGVVGMLQVTARVPAGLTSGGRFALWNDAILEGSPSLPGSVRAITRFHLPDDAPVSTRIEAYRRGMEAVKRSGRNR